MNFIEVNNRSELLIKQLLEVWEDSVKATHTFLSNKELENIKYKKICTTCIKKYTILNYCKKRK